MEVKSTGLQNALKFRLALPGGVALFLGIASIIIISFYLIDITLTEFFHKNNTLMPWAQKITKLGDGTVILMFLSVLLVHSVMTDDFVLSKHIVYILLICLLIGLICNGIKIILARARPIEYFENGLYGFQFFRFGHHFASFPSGHTMMIVAAFYSIGKIRPKLLLPLMFCALLIGFSRVIVGAHYFSDIVAGMYFSVCLVELCDGYLKPLYQKKYMYPHMS